MDFNLLSSVLLIALIVILTLLSIKTFLATKRHSKMVQDTYMDLQEQVFEERFKLKQLIQKNEYIESYNKCLFNKLFEITRELLLTKKIIFEAHYN